MRTFSAVILSVSIVAMLTSEPAVADILPPPTATRTVAVTPTLPAPTGVPIVLTATRVGAAADIPPPPPTATIASADVAPVPSGEALAFVAAAIGIPMLFLFGLVAAVVILVVRGRRKSSR